MSMLLLGVLLLFKLLLTLFHQPQSDVQIVHLHEHFFFHFVPRFSRDWAVSRDALRRNQNRQLTFYFGHADAHAVHFAQQPRN